MFSLTNQNHNTNNSQNINNIALEIYHLINNNNGSRRISNEYVEKSSYSHDINNNDRSLNNISQVLLGNLG